MNDLDEASPPDSEKPHTRKRRQHAGLLISWPALALVLTAVTLASVGTLVIVGTTSGADTLATVALVLAILSFGAQLIVTAAQTASANEQYRQVNRLYEDTRAVLQRIRAQSKMLLSNQSDQFNKILDHVLSPSAIESAVAEARGEGSDPSATDEASDAQAADANEVAKLLRASAERALSEDRAARSQRGPESGGASSAPDNMHRFPPVSEGAEVLAGFLQLSDQAKTYIQEAASPLEGENKRPFRRARLLPYDFGSVPKHLLELEEAGLIKLDPYRSSGRTRTGCRFTPEGLTAVRFYSGRGVVPDYLRPLYERPAGSSGTEDVGHSKGRDTPEAE